MPVVISQFSPNDKTPGFFGQVQYGTAGQSFAGLPIALLLVGVMNASGTLAYDTQIQQIYQDSDADTFAGIGSELAVMAYDALEEQTDIPVFIASPKPPTGATAATATLTISGTWSVAGTIGIRIDGYLVTVGVGASDATTAVATNLAAAINGANEGRLPITATAVSSTVVLACSTPGVRGNQHVVFIQPAGSQSAIIIPSGMGLSLTGAPWVTGTVYPVGSYLVPTAANGYYYKATAVSGSGTSGVTQPTWPTTVGTTVVDNTGANQITWTCWGQIVNGGGVTLGGGAGLETYTNLLNTLASQGYGRIALACNDSTSLAAWKTSIDTEAGPLTGYLQHAICAVNTTTTAAVALAQTTLNDPRFETLFLQSGETHPSRTAASMAASRAFQEVSDPDFNYDGYVLSTVTAQSQPLDIPIHSVLVSLLNTGVTPLTTIGGQVQVVRAITTKCLTNAQPDYSTLDVGFAVVPDFVLMYMKGVWSTFQKSNSRVRGPLASGEKQPASGVAYPDLWNSSVTAALMQMDLGLVPGTCAPILFNVENMLPVSDLDPTSVGRLMTACPVDVMPDLHQLGISVQQV